MNNRITMTMVRGKMEQLATMIGGEIQIDTDFNMTGKTAYFNVLLPDRRFGHQLAIFGTTYSDLWYRLDAAVRALSFVETINRK